MHIQCPQLLALIVLCLLTVRAYAGTLFYVPIPAPDTDANSGISAESGYTTAVDGGNTTDQHRVVNDITLDAMPGSGDSVSADNCTITALTGELTNGSGSKDIPADGVLAGVLSDMIYNFEAGDNSQQEIVLDPESLTAGMTYDLRVYVYSAGAPDRQVNLAFFGDGRAPAETGFFNEDDARTSPGGFTDSNQVYYINYRYIWDGETTPGITITQKSGSAPFCFYALTNQEVVGTAEAAPLGSEAQEIVAEAEEEGLNVGLVEATSDQVGIESDTFYTAESLNSNGRWVNVANYGRCWQPTKVSAEWRPYTDGSWRYADDCGWTWVSEEPWAWACYHYGRWVRAVDRGWCWVPGTVWSGGWVSWRRGTGDDCGSCVGWAPLPPEAPCDVGVGVSTWVDNVYDIGPDWWTFVNVRDFGRDSYSRCGSCIVDRGSYINIVRNSVNITNISFVNVNVNVNVRNTFINVYNGGPDYNWCNTEIRRHHGRGFDKIIVDRFHDPDRIRHGKKLGGWDGRRVSLPAPRVRGQKHPKHLPKVAGNIPAEKIDKGWRGIKDRDQRRGLREKIAQEAKGKTPVNTHAKLPEDVATRLGKGREKLGRHGANRRSGGGDLSDRVRQGKGRRVLPAAGPDATADTAAQQVGPGGTQGKAGGTGRGLHPGKRSKVGGGQARGAAGRGREEPAAGQETQEGVAGRSGGRGRPGEKGRGRRAAGELAGQQGEQQEAGPALRPGGKGKGRRQQAGTRGRERQQPGREQVGDSTTEQDVAGRRSGKGRGKRAAGEASVQQGQQQQAGSRLRPGRKGKGRHVTKSAAGQAQAGQAEPAEQRVTGRGRAGGKGKRRNAGATGRQTGDVTAAQTGDGRKKGRKGQARQGIQQPTTEQQAGQAQTRRGAGRAQGQRKRQQQQQAQQQAQQQQAAGGGKRARQGRRKQKQQQQAAQPTPQSQTQTRRQGSGRGQQRRRQQQTKQSGQQAWQQQLQPRQPQQAGARSGAGNRGQNRRRQQVQRQQQVQQPQQQQQKKQQRGRGRGKKRGAVPTPTPY